MNKEGAFTRLVDLIASPKSDAEPRLHQLFMELLYEMARIQRVKIDDLSTLKSSAHPRAQPVPGIITTSTEADPFLCSTRR